MSRVTRSPGKLILSGEHAVVLGCPALAMAVTLEADLHATPQNQPCLTLQLPGRKARDFALADLSGLLGRVRHSHQETPANCPEPEVLLAACAALLDPKKGMRLRFASDIPLGSGLGSSAAFILALLKNLSPEISDQTLFDLAITGETFQHARSSGLDVATSLRGGLIHFMSGAITPLTIKTLPAFSIYNTGKPQSSTGECVEKSRSIFGQKPNLISDFTETTTGIQQALESENHSAWQSGIQKNHTLLCQLGVVPEAVQKVICGLEATGNPAKICGAGSVRGDAAGMVLVSGPEPHLVPPHWQPLPLKFSLQGTRVISE